MKSGLTLVEMAQEIQSQAEKKKDYIADTRQLEVNPDSTLTIQEEAGSFQVTEHTHSQIAQRLNIPAKYYKFMLQEAPELLASNINHWFGHKPESRMVRTLDGKARAFLSDRYRRIDNYQIASAILPVLNEFGDNLQIASVGLTEQRLYIKAVNKGTQLDVKVGDPVQAGVIVSNSEIGAGAIRIEPLVYRLVCTNGLIVHDRGMKKYHVGRTIDIEEQNYQILADDTKRAEDKVLMLKIRDMVKAATSEALFSQIVEQMRQTTERKIENNPVQAVEVLGNKHSLNQKEQSGILEHLIRGGDLSQYGLLNAVTRTSQDLESYDRATELEAMGSTVLNLQPNQWKEIAVAR